MMYLFIVVIPQHFCADAAASAQKCWLRVYDGFLAASYADLLLLWWNPILFIKLVVVLVLGSDDNKS